MEKLPDAVLEVLETLEQAGGEAYLVGGCVRDRLLGRPVHDWDLCTSLRPERVQAAFPHTVPTGLRHGTVTVLHGGCAFEVTTYRTDGAYRDHRRPDRVTFGTSLREDLLRRDFTVNAMAMDAAGQVTDCFGGREDLRAGVLRCVGDPDRRFSEDALRILRAVRFSVQLGFGIEAETEAAMARCAPGCADLSAERVRDEVEKILCSTAPERLGQLIGLGVLARFGLAEKLDLTPLRRLPPEPAARWAGLSLLTGCELRALRLDRVTVRLAEGAAACRAGGDAVTLKAMAAANGWAALRCAALLGGFPEAVEAIAASGDCVMLRDLAVSGADFPDVRGPALGELLRALLADVWAEPRHNDRAYLLARADAYGQELRKNL